MSSSTSSPALIDDLPSEHGFSVGPCVLTPASGGTVRLRSADPTAKPYILHNYYAEEPDLSTMVEGVRITAEIVSQRALGPYTRRPHHPPASTSNADCAHTSAGTPLPSTTLSARAGWALTTRP